METQLALLLVVALGIYVSLEMSNDIIKEEHWSAFYVPVFCFILVVWYPLFCYSDRFSVSAAVDQRCKQHYITTSVAKFLSFKNISFGDVPKQ